MLRSLIAQWSVAAACAAHLEQRVLDGLLHNCLHASAPRRSHVLDGRVLALGWQCPALSAVATPLRVQVLTDQERSRKVPNVSTACLASVDVRRAVQ